MVKKLLCTILGTASLALSAQSDCLSGTSINEDFVGALAPSELDGISIGYSGDQTGEYAFTRNAGDLSVVVNQPSGGWKPMGLSVAGGYLDLSGNSAVEVSLTNDGDLGIEVYFTFYSGASADKKLVSGTAEAAPYGGVIPSGETKTYTFDVSTGKKRVWTGSSDCFSGGVKVGDICIGDAGFDVSEISLIEWTVNGAGYSDPENGWTVPALVDYPISMHHIKAGTCGSTTDPDDDDDNNDNDDGGTGSSCVGAVTDHGHGTWYNNLDVQPNGVVRCSFERSTILNTKYGAMDKGLLQEDNNAKYCGMCVEATGDQGTAIIQIVDECPDCYDRGPNGENLDPLNTKFGDIDLSIDAFQAVVGTDHVGIGIGNFNWKEVSCPWQNNISLRFESAHQWNVKVIVANHLNRVAKVELTHNGQYYDMIRGQDNGWVLGEVGGVSISGALKSVRVTDIYGSVITVEDIDFTTEKLWESYPTTEQFPACTVTSTGELVNSLNYVSAYPNPANTNITFAGVEDAQAIEILNINGQVVASKVLNNETAQISLDISNLASGIYVAKMIGNNSAGAVTFVKK